MNGNSDHFPKPLVGFANINAPGYHTIKSKFDFLLNKIHWNWEEIPGKKIFIKLNCMSGEVVPGTCTSPWIVKAVLENLRSYLPELEIWIGDGDGYSTRQVEAYMKNWKVGEICKDYDAKPVNLSKRPVKEVSLGPVFGVQPMPDLLLEVDAILDLAVPKTHCLTGLTASLKNNWGLLPTTRYRFHKVVNEAIAELNSFFKNVVLSVADLTITQEGPGPRCGIPRVANAILISRDRVALDTACAKFMGLDLASIPHLKTCQNAGVGSMSYELCGDEWVPPENFIPASSKDHLLYHIRDILAGNPITYALIFGFTPVYWLVGKFARFYNRHIWYASKGKSAASEIIKGTFYEDEYKDIIIN